MGGFFGQKGGVSVTINFQEKFFQKGGPSYKGVYESIYNENIVMRQRLVITEEERKIILEQNRKKPWTPPKEFLSKSDDQILDDIENHIEDFYDLRKDGHFKDRSLRSLIELALSFDYDEFEFEHRDEPEFKRIVNDLTNKYKSRSTSKTGVVYNDEFSHNDILQRISGLMPTKEMIIKDISEDLFYDLVDDGMSEDDAKQLIPKYIEHIQTQVKNLFK
jgi:hypothetical protein